MFDNAIADAAFALPRDGVSDVVKGQFGPLIVRVVGVTPGSVKTYDEVEDTLKKEIAADRAAGEVQAMHDKIEDARVSGKSLAEAAKAVGLEARPIAAVDAQGRDPNGAAVDLPDKPSCSPPPSRPTSASTTRRCRPRTAAVSGSTCEGRPRARPPVRRGQGPKSEKQWRADAVAKALSAKAADMVKQIDAGATLASLAQAAGLEAKSAADIRRSGGAALAPSVVTAVFAVPPGGAGSAATPEGRLVFKMTADATPPTRFDDPAVKTPRHPAYRGVCSPA